MSKNLVEPLAKSLTLDPGLGGPLIGTGIDGVAPTPSDTERIQDVGFDTGTGWSGTGTVDTGTGRGTMTVGQTLIATFTSPLIAGQTYTIIINRVSGSQSASRGTLNMGATQEIFLDGSPNPFTGFSFIADAASTTLTIQVTDIDTLVLNSVSLIGP